MSQKISYLWFASECQKVNFKFLIEIKLRLEFYMFIVLLFLMVYGLYFKTFSQ